MTEGLFFCTILSFYNPSASFLGTSPYTGEAFLITAYRLLNKMIDMFTNTSEITVDLRIRYSHYCQSVVLKKSSSFLIMLFTIVCVMPGTIKLYNELCLGAIKIHNVFSHNSLTHKPYRIFSQKVIPKMLFFFCHIFSEHPCNGNYLLVVFSLHNNPSVSFADSSLYTREPLLGKVFDDLKN